MRYLLANFKLSSMRLSLPSAGRSCSVAFISLLLGLSAPLVFFALLSLSARPAAAESIRELARRKPVPREQSPRLRESLDHLLHGHPEQVVALLGDAALAKIPRSKGNRSRRHRGLQEKLALARAFLDLDQPARARKTLRSCLRRPLCARLAGEIELQTGRRSAAVKLLSRAMRAHPKDIGLRVSLGEALLSIGKSYEARQVLDPIADWYQAGGQRTVSEMIDVARSLAFNGFFKDASVVMAEASEAAAEGGETLAVESAWGQLFLSKYNFRDADRAFQKVLAINPHHLSSVVGMARIDLDSDNDVNQARRRLDALLKRRPLAVLLLRMRAEVALYDEELSRAKRFAGRALRERPDDPRALAVMGATCKLADDKICFAKMEKRALRSNPHDGDFYLVAATYLEMAHRYREVLILLNQALKRDADLWQAHAAMGMSYARLGDDRNARKHLEIAFTNDPYNVRTANVLNVLYDGVLKHMQRLRGEHVDLRVHRRSRKALERTILPFLQESYEELSKKYRMKAHKPLLVEIFPTTEQFSVRTVGLPRLGAHAVCFGHLITSRSPAEKPFNWKMVLYHELSHVFHIQATDGRVPRWLTEGVAMMESAWKNPRWHILAERRLWERLRAGELSPVARFNLAFSQALSMKAIVEAYYQAMYLVKYLQETSGFDKLRAFMWGYGQGGKTTGLIRKIYGLSAEELDRRFAAWLTKKLVRFEKDYRPNLVSIRTRLAKEWRAPSPSRDALRRALAALKRGRRFEARAALERALRPPKTTSSIEAGADLPLKTGEQCAAAFLLMELASAERNTPQAVQYARRLVQVSGARCDGVEQRMVLARAVRDPKEIVALAMPHIRAALAIDPRDPGLVATWVKLALRLGDERAQRRAARQLIALDPNGVDAPTLLAYLGWAPLAAHLGLPAPVAPTKKPGARGLPKRPKKGGLSADRVASLLQDLALGAEALEEVDPTGRAAVLYEARLAMARGQSKMSLPLYREAARRGGGDKARAEVWCELEVAAAKAKAPDDRAEAKRHCDSIRARH